MLMPTRILVPTDFSKCSGRALGQALDIADEYQAKVFLLHVVHEVMDLTGLDFINSDKMIHDFKSNELVWTKRNLQKQLDNFPQANEVEVETIVRQGVPYVEILKVGERKGLT